MDQLPQTIDLEAQHDPFNDGPHENTTLMTGAQSQKHGISDSLVNPRLGFIRKVYGIISMQLCLTVALCTLGVTSPAYQSFQQAHPSLMVLSGIGSLATMIALFCCFEQSKKVPNNYILLGLFTLCEAYLVSYTCTQYEPQSVLMAALMTLAVTISLTVYAFTTKKDFTYFGATFFIFSAVLIMVSLLSWFTQNNFLHMVCVAGGAVFYGFYLIYDTQLVAGGKKHALSLDDYIIGAMIIYLDIIILFIRILELFGERKK